MKWYRYTAQVRRSIKTGDCYYTASHTLIGTLIRFFTQSKVSHVGMFVWLGGRLFCVESTPKGVLMYLASYRLGKVKFAVTHSKVKQYNETFIESVLNDVGRVKYDFLGTLVATFFRTKRAEMNCSTWVARKLKLNFDALERGITPIDVYNRYMV